MLGEKMEQVETEDAEIVEDITFRDALEANMSNDVVAEVADKELSKEEVKVDVPPKEKFDPKEYTKEQEKQKVDVAPPTVAPADMNAAERAMFEKADPQLQAYLSRRAYENRAAFSREMQKVQEQAKHFQSLQNSIEPHKDWLAKKGLSADVVANRAIAWEKAFEQDKTGSAIQYLQAQGVDIYELQEALEGGQVQRQPQEQVEQYIDPKQIAQQIREELRQEQMQQLESSATEDSFNMVQQFISDKPLFRDPNLATQVEAEMTPLVVHYLNTMTPEKALEKAYNTVSQGNETYRNLLDSYGQRVKAEEAKRVAEQARQSSRSISGGMSGANPNVSGLDFRDELRLRLSGGM